MVMVSSETVHVHNVISAKIVYALFLFIFVVVVVFVVFF